ncbi:MAG: hypothetical protein JW863_02605 [Chitinispirillaceae bacterium]|nr:hypothetical protein [Chitinispirillaceae bacterium]
MKKLFRITGFVLLFLLFSVGFRYSPGRPLYPGNIYSIDSLLLIADLKQGIYVYSVTAGDTARLLQTVDQYGVRGIAMKDSTMYIGTWDGVMVYQRNGNGGFDSVNAVYRNDRSYYESYDYESRPFFGCGCNEPIAYGGGSEAGNGTGGSYATFAIIDTFLYVVDGQYLVTFSIAKPESPKRLSYIDVNWTIETIYPMESHLYIGGTNGMYIIDRSDGANPKLAGSVDHFRACDPVVVQDSTAWVTLRSGSFCGISNDELWTVSVADPYHPKQLHTTAAATPYGLAVHDSLLYVANGENGYSLYRIDATEKPLLVRQWDTWDAKDFIWKGNRLFLMAFNAVYIVNVTDPQEPELLYTIQ